MQCNNFLLLHFVYFCNIELLTTINMMRTNKAIYLIAAFFLCVFITAGYFSVVPMLSKNISEKSWVKNLAENSSEQKEEKTENVNSEFVSYYLKSNIIKTSDIAFASEKLFHSADDCSHLFILSILTPPPEIFS
jgi:hypothetical protein